MGFEFIAFGAATVPLSKIVIDKELDMGTYPIRAENIKAPYRPQVWATEELDWGNSAEETSVLSVGGALSTEIGIFIWTNPSEQGRQIRVTATQTGSGFAYPVITIDGVEVYSGTDATFEAGPFWVPPGKQIKLVSSSGIAYGVQVNFYDTGLVGGPITFDLTGKWLALNCDMKGLAATVKIQGVEIPYSDYAMYFPLAPSELTIPGDWDHSQEQPVVRVYK